MDVAQTQYPPANDNQMPQWSRIGHLDKSRYPKPFSKDNRVMPLSTNGGEEDSELMAAAESDLSSVIRVDYLEKSIRFLKQQHDEVLRSLHFEIEKLRKENKGTNFEIFYFCVFKICYLLWISKITLKSYY